MKIPFKLTGPIIGGSRFLSLLCIIIISINVTTITRLSQALQFPSSELAALVTSSNSVFNRDQTEMASHPITVNGTTNNGAGNPAAFSLGDSTSGPTNYYSSVQAQKFRVNVSNICERNQMRATIRISRPFYGLIHTKDNRRRPACSLDGNGDQTYAMEISYTLNPNDSSHCGVVSHQLQPSAATSRNNHSTNQPFPVQKPQQTLSVVLVVRLHKSIEFSDDRYFLLSCANRCARPDCSSASGWPQEPETSHLAGSSLTQAQPPPQPLRSPFLASESVISSSSTASIVRANNNTPILLAHSAEAANGSSSSNNKSLNPAWPTEKCDTMLDLKFQWLVKLCWILSTLLAITCCATFYSCYNSLHGLRASKLVVGPKQCQPVSRAKSIQGKSMSLNNSKQVACMYSPPPIQSENISWTGPATHNANSDHGLVDHTNLLSNQMRNATDENNNNLYLAKQQLMLDNLRTQMASNLGRSGELPGTSLTHHQPLAARIKRRRSIGSSMGPATTCQDLGHQDHGSLSLSSASYHHHHHHHQQLGADQAAKLMAANLRAKSRSQTTIYYEQSQDPFKAVPFNYAAFDSNNNNNNASSYQSDCSENSNRFYLNGSDFVPSEVYGMPPAAAPPSAQNKSRPPLEHAHLQTFVTQSQQHNPGGASVEQMSHPMPPEVPQHLQFTLNGQETMLRKHGFRANMKPSYVPPPQVETVQVQGARKLITQAQQQPPPSSQFDPQNSRQLADLIQHKHRQQMEQANRTAANMQSSTEVFLELQRQQQQAPQNTIPNQQRNSTTTHLSWR